MTGVPLTKGWLIRTRSGNWYWTDKRIAATAALTEGLEVVNLQSIAPLDASSPGNVTILVTKAQRDAARNSGKKLNDWISDTLRRAAEDRPPMTPVPTERLHQLHRMANRHWCLVSSVGAITSAEAHSLIEEVIAHRESAQRVTETLTVVKSQAERGADKAGCDGWRSQEMCRQIAQLIDDVLTALPTTHAEPSAPLTEASRTPSRLVRTLSAASERVAQNPERAEQIRENWTDGSQPTARSTHASRTEVTDAMVEAACSRFVSESDDIWSSSVWPESPEDDGDRGYGQRARLIPENEQHSIRAAMRFALSDALRQGASND